jgi:hypothetical protein
VCFWNCAQHTSHQVGSFEVRVKMFFQRPADWLGITVVKGQCCAALCCAVLLRHAEAAKIVFDSGEQGLCTARAQRWVQWWVQWVGWFGWVVTQVPWQLAW